MPKSIKIILIALAGILLVPVALFTLCISFAVVYSVGIYIVTPHPDVPTIKEAEFPFEIVYEKNDEIFVVEDVLICKYEGIYTHSGGKSRCWGEYFKSGNDDALVVFKEGATEIHIGIGDPWYYMDDPNNFTAAGEMKPSTSKVIRENGIHGEPVSEEKLYSEYGIKIISWELSDPIENTYKKWYQFWK